MYFLAIVSQEDLLNGNIVPSYILCWHHGTSENRSRWRVYRANTPLASAPKVLVKYPSGNPLMVDFLSRYRTRDHMYVPNKKSTHKKSQKYYPQGALFWFECNEYGERTGAAVFVKRIPDRNIIKPDEGKQRLQQALNQKIYLHQQFSSDPFAVPLEQSHVKPQLYQGTSNG